jgi:hypothetical protein
VGSERQCEGADERAAREHGMLNASTRASISRQRLRRDGSDDVDSL